MNWGAWYKRGERSFAGQTTPNLTGTVIPPDTRVSCKATQPQTHTIDELKQLRISMSNFTDLLCNSQPVGPCARKMAADRPVVFSAAHIWPLITLGLLALFLFPEKRRPEGSGPTALQHVQAGLQHHCKCHTTLARSLEGGLR